MNYSDLAKTEFIKIFTSIDGPKILMIDEHIKNLISTLFFHSDLLSYEIFNVVLINNTINNTIKHISCIIIISDLTDDLYHKILHPEFDSYYLYSSKIIENKDLIRIADCDNLNLIKKIEEIYIDLIPVSSKSCVINSDFSISNKIVLDSLTSLLLSMKLNPQIIYSYNGENDEKCKDSKIIAENIGTNISKFNCLFPAQKNGTLIILNRNDDPLVPLITHWNYNSLIYNILDVKDNTVFLPDKKEILNEKYDDFFSTNRFSNWTNICQLLPDMAKKYEQFKKTDETNNSVFITEKNSIFNKTTRHILLCEKILAEIKNRNLIDLHVFEHKILTKNVNVDDMVNFISQRLYSNYDIFRICIIYSIICENKSDISILKSELNKIGTFDFNKLDKAQKISNNLNSKIYNKNISLNILKNLVSVLNINDNNLNYDNILIKNIIENILNNKLSTNFFHCINSEKKETEINIKNNDKIIIFMNGGITYEEISILHKLAPNNNIILTSTHIINDKKFINDM
jgi:hypothetical protein